MKNLLSDPAIKYLRKKCVSARLNGPGHVHPAQPPTNPVRALCSAHTRPKHGLNTACYANDWSVFSPFAACGQPWSRHVHALCTHCARPLYAVFTPHACRMYAQFTLYEQFITNTYTSYRYWYDWFIPIPIPVYTSI